jgi:NADPH:quinone reductase-like Zn-dependent oxidoreductase
MPKAVRFDQYGGVDVLQVVDVARPDPGSGEVLVRVRAAGINPGEAKIREGMLHSLFPATFPSGEGSDLAGVVHAVGDGVEGVAVGDEVIGYVDTRSSHAEYVVVDAGNLTPKPEGVSWEIAGSLFVAGTTAVAAIRAVDPKPGEVLVIAGAAGGVGSIAVQLAVRTGAKVIALASEGRHAWLSAHGAVPVTYGEGVEQRIAEAAGGASVDALIDLSGDGYVDLALKLGVAKDRIDTIADFAAAAKHGVKAEGGSSVPGAATLAELAAMIDAGDLEVPIARVYPLSEVRDAYTEVQTGHVHGKIVLTP